jgi:hypothetical protein
VELLRSLRTEISSRRWEVLLELDALKDLLVQARSNREDPAVRALLAVTVSRIDHLQRLVAAIPNEIIPPF